MSISSKNFIQTILFPQRCENKADKRIAWGLTIGLGLLSLGIVQLVCLIVKSSGCFDQKEAKGDLSNRSISLKTGQNDSRINGVFSKVKPTSHAEIDRQVEEYNFTDRAWLNTLHIQTYFYYLCSRFHHLGPDLVVGPDKETFSSLKIKDFSDPNFTLYPVAINTGDHWVLLIVDTQNRTLEYYDSRYVGITPKIEENLTAFTSQLNKGNEDRPFSLVAKLKKKLQSDHYQCGIWILYFLEMRIKNSEFDFNALKAPSKIISSHRKKVRKKILESYQKLLLSRRALQEKYNAHYYGVEEGRQRFREDYATLCPSGQKDFNAVRAAIYNTLLIRHYERIKKFHGEEVLLPQLLSAK